MSQNLIHCASTAARSAASCAAGSREAGAADDGVGTSMTLGVGLDAGLLTTAEPGEGSLTDALGPVDEEVPGLSGVLVVQAETLRAITTPHRIARRRTPGLVIL